MIASSLNVCFCLYIIWLEQSAIIKNCFVISFETVAYLQIYLFGLESPCYFILTKIKIGSKRFDISRITEHLILHIDKKADYQYCHMLYVDLHMSPIYRSNNYMRCFSSCLWWRHASYRRFCLLFSIPTVRGTAVVRQSCWCKKILHIASNDSMLNSAVDMS